jgi:hypothetical protein
MLLDDGLMLAASAAQARFNSTCNRRSSSVPAIAGRVRWSNTRRLPWLFSLEPRPCVQTRHLSVWFRGAILLCKSPRPAHADASIDGGWAVQGQIRRPAFLMNCPRACHGEMRRDIVTALSRSIGRRALRRSALLLAASSALPKSSDIATGPALGGRLFGVGWGLRNTCVPFRNVAWHRRALRQPAAQQAA